MIPSAVMRLPADGDSRTLEGVGESLLAVSGQLSVIPRLRRALSYLSLSGPDYFRSLKCYDSRILRAEVARLKADR